jgi:hypothetical protein
MADTLKAKAIPEEESQKNGFDCCPENMQDMFEMMKQFCGDKEKSFDCCTMMKQRSGEDPEKPQK